LSGIVILSASIRAAVYRVEVLAAVLADRRARILVLIVVAVLDGGQVPLVVRRSGVGRRQLLSLIHISEPTRPY